MPAPVRVRNSGPLGRPSMAACTAGKAGRGTGTRAGLSPLPTKVNVTYPRTGLTESTVSPAISLVAPACREDGDGVMCRSQRTSGGEEGGVLQHRKDPSPPPPRGD